MVFDREKYLSEVKLSDQDVGSTGVQVVNLTAKIYELSSHIKENHKDNSAIRGLNILLGRRKRFLKYLENTNLELFQTVKGMIKRKK